jgi:hypothetical protein
MKEDFKKKALQGIVQVKEKKRETEMDKKQIERCVSEAWKCLKSEDFGRAIEMFTIVLANSALLPEYFIGRRLPLLLYSFTLTSIFFSCIV